MKLMADGDLFGRPGKSENKDAPYYGRLFVRTGNGEHPYKRVFKVTCRNELIDE